MAAAPPFKVYRDKKYIAACKNIEDALALCGLSGNCVIKYGHSTVVWREGEEEVSAAECLHYNYSFEIPADIVRSRI